MAKVPKNSIFKNVELGDLYNLNKDKLRSEYREYQMFSFEKKQDPQPKRKLIRDTIIDSYKLFDLLQIDYDERIALLSEFESNNIVNYLVTNPGKKSVYKNELNKFSEISSDLKVFSDWKSTLENFYIQGVFTHLVCGIERMLFELVIFEHKPSCPDKNKEDKHINEACKYYEEIISNNGSKKPNQTMPSCVRISQFDNVRKEFIWGVPLEEVMKRSRQLESLPPPSIAFYIQSYQNQWANYKDLKDSLKEKLARQLFDLHLKLHEAKWLTNSRGLTIDTSKNTQIKINEILTDSKKVIDDYRRNEHTQTVKIFSDSVQQDLSSMIDKAEDELKTLVQYWTNSPIFKMLSKLGIQMLHKIDQLDHRDNFSIYIMVLDPDEYQTDSKEWQKYLGCIMDRLVLNCKERLFFACTLAYFRSKFEPLKEYKDENRFIFRYKNRMFVKLFFDSVEELKTSPEIQREDSIAKRQAEKQDEIPTQPNNDSQSTAQKPIQDNFINILLLGETGVGKSTFINAYYNYLKYTSLDEALQNDTECLITSTFSYMNNARKMERITIKKNTKGTDDEKEDTKPNEVTIPGESVTQCAKAYTITTKDGCIRIIDTPGIGDSRGVKKDKENFKETIEYLAKFDHLNAICILLKPNVKRIENQTRYCFKELFSHLNKTSIQNVIFCFTNTRGTSFKPGDTWESLKEFIVRDIEEVSNVKVPLSINNVVCLDNEAFRYLVLAKEMRTKKNKNQLFDEFKEEDTFRRSWSISSQQSKKLTDYARNLKNLKIQEIVHYNQSRTMNVELVEKILKAFLILSKRENSSRQDGSTAKNQRIQIINLALEINNYFRSNAVTIHNDHLDAHLEERIGLYKSSLNDWKYSDYLEKVRLEYKGSNGKLDPISANNPIDVDEKIRELNRLLEEIFSLP